MVGGEANLRAMFELADRHDYQEGLLAYQRYHHLLQEIAAHYQVPFRRVVAGFVSLSPNSDYFGNLRSLVSVLEGMKDGAPIDGVVVSTYEHCRDRAFAYLTGRSEFLSHSRGLKVTNFYRNILDPNDGSWVTIDGHMVATFRGVPGMTMKEAIIRRRSEYHEIAGAVKALAFREFILPHQYQAVIWFARKRVYNTRFTRQGDLFDWVNGDLWKTARDIASIKPYPRKRIAE